MGYMFEEIIRRFSENAEAGDHYTPREIVRLLVRLGLAEGCEYLQQEGKNITVADVACGTGGMLSVASEELHERYPGKRIILFGQEVNEESHAICLSDMLVKGQEANHVRFADTMKEDCFPKDHMLLQLVNPPFGQPWGGKDAATGVEAAVRAEHAQPQHISRFPAGLPASGDMQMLFMQHIIHKMDATHGRACVISNGSPLFSGGTSSGESQIRRWMLENDYIEAIIGLPGSLFYNTDISIYVWVLSKNKRADRKGKVQLIDATEFWTPMRRSLGNKRRYITEKQIEDIVNLYTDFKNSERCKIVDSKEFLYHEYSVYQPLQRNYAITTERIDSLAEGKFTDSIHNPSKLAELRAIDSADLSSKEAKTLAALEQAEPVFAKLLDILRENTSDKVWYDEKDFIKHLKTLLLDLPAYRDKQTPAQTKTLLEKVADRLSIMDKDAPLRYDRKGNIVIDPATKDTELVSLAESVHDYMEREVLPYIPDAIWVDEETDKTTKTGAEIPFTRYFYKYQQPESSQVLLERFFNLEDELKEILGGLR